MKMNKQSKPVLPFAVTVLLAAGQMLAQTNSTETAHKGDMLHLSLQAKMVNSGTLPKASGNISVSEDEHANRSSEEIRISANHLEAGAAYQLTAAQGDNSNVTSVVDFNADAKGNAHLDLQDNGGAPTHGKGKLALPADWEQVSEITALTIVDTNGQPVLTSDLTAPDKLTYLVKKDLSTDAVKASLQINAHTKKAQIRVTASGLTAGAAYSLALNGTVAQTGNADKKGKLKIETDLPNPADILALQSVALLDDGGNEVVSTTLP